jgi:hypothetical protein
MRIYDSLQGHLAQLEGHDLHTLSQGKKFVIDRVFPDSKREVEWLIELSVGEKGNIGHVYLTDLLRSYTWLVSNHWESWATRKQLSAFMDDEFESGKFVSNQNSSYMMAILATFDDVEKRDGQEAAVKFVPKSAAYK